MVTPHPTFVFSLSSCMPAIEAFRGERAEPRAVSLLGSLKRNRAGGRRGCHVLDAKRPTMLTSHTGIDFSAGAEGECSAARRSPLGELPSPCLWRRKNQTTCPRPASRDSRHVLTARGRQVTLPTPPSLPKKRELLCLAAEAGQPRGRRRATSASGVSGPAACRCARSKHRLRSRRRRSSFYNGAKGIGGGLHLRSRAGSPRHSQPALVIARGGARRAAARRHARAPRGALPRRQPKATRRAARVHRVAHRVKSSWKSSD